MPLLWRRLHRSPTGLLNPSEQWIASVPCVKKGLACYFTMDAGPNVKVLCQKKDEEAILTQLKKDFSSWTLNRCSRRTRVGWFTNDSDRSVYDKWRSVEMIGNLSPGQIIYCRWVCGRWTRTSSDHRCGGSIHQCDDRRRPQKRQYPICPVQWLADPLDSPQWRTSTGPPRKSFSLHS